MNSNDWRETIPNGRDDIYTVTEISEAIRQSLESEFPTVRIIGEISNFRAHSSGHCYFSLRDESSTLAAVVFRRYAALLAFEPADGMLAVASGRITHYSGSGRTQVVVYSLEPAGRGAMELEFRRLLQKLMEEGLTAPERKREIPSYPRRIVVITSPTGAVIEDMLDTLARRWPVAEVVHIGVDVQGPHAVRSIVRAFEIANGIEGADLVILARGGGSIEDLWSFNTEPVARAIAGSSRPVITGIGHEIDTTIADYVADIRAATPTAAAELAAPLITEVEDGLEQTLVRLGELFRNAADDRLRVLEFLLRSSSFPVLAHRIERATLRIDDLAGRLSAWWKDRYGRGMRSVERSTMQLAGGIERRIRDLETCIAWNLQRLSLEGPGARIASRKEAVNRYLSVLKVAISARAAIHRREVEARMRALRGLHPRGVLKRGYTYCTSPGDDTIIGRSKGLSKDDPLTVNFYDGAARCIVRRTRKGTAWPKR
ncbi:MAG: exodeoxyribonuclease VII large subunit [bacterium]|nr:MAG: exodeoxyribonuclease VII large subunit [bacterium]